MTKPAVYINVEEAANLIWALRREQIYAQLETGTHPVIIGELPIDNSTPSPDDDTAELDYMEAQDGSAA